MEDVKINAFLSSGYGLGDGSGYGSGDGLGDGSGYGWGDGSGDGSGNGSGYGWGDGSGDGWGNGSGYGSGDGLGDGSGYGWGDGSGYGDIKQINGESVYDIDDVPTVIRSIRGNIAHGAMLNGDLTLTPCYIAKQDGTFAHGETVREAMSALRDKLFEDMPEEERIEAFITEHEDRTAKYSGRNLWEWHHRLTGSCEMGRNQFAADRQIDIDNSEFTVDEFIAMTENAYGGDVIRKLKGVLCGDGI